jgi:hypothetical protein
MPYFYNPVTVDVHRCARCGNDHKALRFSQFQERNIDKNTHWALCPVLQEPILLEVREAPKSQAISNNLKRGMLDIMLGK